MQRDSQHRLPAPALARRAGVLLMAMAWTAALAGAQRQPARAAAPRADSSAAARRGVHDRAELEGFLDGVMIGTMRDKHVAGAVVAVVKDGALLFTKGYGYADVARRVPVDPAHTLFRVGSITKLFTWTAVMQQVEAGKLDLDTDVNRYLDFKIPATYTSPITLRHLMTHTPGFEDDLRALWAPDSSHLVPTGRWLATHIPARVRPPGTYSSYSNYGAGLAGYIVERVTGVPWAEYVQRRILDTLGMTEASAEQPLPLRLRADMSQGYHFAAGGFEAKDWEYIAGAAPAGSMSAAATAMATFMLAHLGNGATGGRRLLRDSTALLMHARAFGHDPRLPGFALGFYEQSSHGLRIVGHGGDTDWFHSDLALIPSEHLGVFVSYNTDTGGELSFGPFLDAFLDHYYPAAPATPSAPAEARADAMRVAGQYWFNRRPYRNFQRAAGLSGRATVVARPDGSLTLLSPFGDLHLVHVGSLLYQEEVGTGLVAFAADPSGAVSHGFVGGAPMMAMDRLPWTASPTLHSVIVALMVLASLGTLWAVTRRFIRRRLGAQRPEDGLPKWSLLAAVAALNLTFLVLIGGMIASDADAFVNQPPPIFFAALALPVLAAVLTLAALVAAVQQWTRRQATVGARLRYNAVVLICVLFLWSLNEWNLLGWRI